MSGAARFAEVRRLFDKLCDLPPDEQQAALRECGADPQLLAEVESLLHAQTESLQRVQRPLRAALEIGDGVLDAGTRLGPWRITGRIASGGMGTVYRAERADGHFELVVAVKVLHGFVDTAAQERLARERQILADLAHPDIARLLDGGCTADGQPYLVMEHVVGEPIDCHCAGNGLALRARIELFLRVCGAVEHAHRQLIVHCDLKPSNVLVRSNGAPVLLDFGISRALASGRGDDDAAGLFTPAYASPEQLAGRRVSTLSDVYSLGLILYELLLGRRPPPTGDATAPRTALRPSSAATSPALRRRLHGDLDAIVRRATLPLPAQRYASVAELAQDLRRHLQHRPVHARGGGVVYRSLRWFRRQWRFAAMLGLLLLLAITFSLGLRRQRDRALQAEQVARVQARTAEQVSDFLVSVFQFANPARHPSRDISARDILDHGAARIDDELDGQPRVKARLLYVLGRAYEMIGLGERAGLLYRQSATAYLHPGVDAPLDAARSLSQLAALQRNGERLDEAAATVAEVFALRHDRVAADSLAMADSLNTRGLVEGSRGRYAEAERDFLAALSIRRQRQGDDSDEVAVTLQNLGLLQHQQGREQRAQAYYRQALRIKEARYGAEHPVTLVTLRNYATSLSASGDWQQAIPMLQRALQAGRRVYGEDNPNLASMYNEFGSALHDRGRFREAADNYRHAMAIYAALGMQQSGDYAPPLNNLASALEDMGDIEAALPLFRQSLALRKRVYGEHSAVVARAEYNLGRALMKSGHMQEAGDLLERALRERRGLLGKASPEIAQSELQRAEWLRRAGRLDEAGQAFSDSEHSPAVFNAGMRALRARGLGLIALAQGRVEEARSQLREAWTTMARAWGETHPLTAAAALDYAQALLVAGQAQQAGELLRQAAPVVDASFVAQSPQRRALRRLLPQ